jgi:hypothetical protein
MFASTNVVIELGSIMWLLLGISFGGMIAFIFADLIMLPILDIYHRYYGWKVAGFLFVTFFAAMAAAALLIELPLDALGLIPDERNAKVVEASVTWNYKTFLNIAFLAVAAVLVWRFVRTGGLRASCAARFRRPCSHRAPSVGNVMVNVVPAPGEVSRAIDPPWAATSSATMARPSPVPGRG